jgi:acyl-CoA thioesterase I
MSTKNKAIVIFFLFPGFIWATAPKIKVACIGNSITALSDGYVVKLAKMPEAAGYQFQQDGVGGTTLLKNGDMPYWTKGKFSQVFSFQPKIVTIKLGTNDTKPQNWDSHYGEFKRDYLAMIDTLGTLASNPKIFMVLPVPIFSNTFGIRDSALQKILSILKQIGQERNLPVIDANTPLKNFPQYFTDGVHPNSTGSDTIAQVIFRALMSATSAYNQLLQVIQNKTPDVQILNGTIFLSVPSPGVTTFCLFDLRGSLLHLQTFQQQGRYVFNSQILSHGRYLLRTQCNGKTTSFRTLIVP